MLVALAIIAVTLSAIFFLGRYGWKIGGFGACQSAGIENVEVTDTQVTITGFYPGSFPEGFLGYYAEENSERLYVGFRFSGLFGLFEPGDFTISIPVKGKIREVIAKTPSNEYPIWNGEEPAAPQGERPGVYVKLKTHDVCQVSISYAHESSGLVPAGNTILESDQYLFLENHIALAAKEAGSPLPFTLTATKSDGSVLASGSFAYDCHVNHGSMYLTVTADGKILNDTAGSIPAPVEKPTTLEAYATVLDEYYTALNEKWDSAQVMDAGLNYMVAESHPENALAETGYGIMDLDGNGVEELAIGSMVEDAFYGKILFSLYTLDSSGAPTLLFSSTERDRYYYGGGSRFANLGSSAWNDSFATTLKLENGELLDMGCVTSPADYVQMELIPFSQWIKQGGTAT